MPKVGRPRTIQAESNLARWLKLLRERHGYSYERTATLLTEAGCPMGGSTVYKIERQVPRRRISTNELAAIALVFRISETELVRSPDTAEDEHLRTLLQAAEQARERAEDAMLGWLKARRVVGIHLHRSARGAADGRLTGIISEIGAPELMDVGWPAGERTITGESWDAGDQGDRDTDGDLMPESDLDAVREWLTS